MVGTGGPVEGIGRLLDRVGSNGGPAAPATLTLTGDWQVKVELEGISATVTVDGPASVTVTEEKIGKLPQFNRNGPAYARGEKLAGVRAQECSVRHALAPTR